MLKTKNWRYESAPRGCFDASPPRLSACSVRTAPPCRFTADIKPRTGPSAGRAECRHRPSQMKLGKLICRGPPALPVKLPVHHRPSVEER